MIYKNPNYEINKLFYILIITSGNRRDFIGAIK